MSLKLEQVQEVVEFARGRGVFVSLRTSYGNSLEEYGILSAFVESLRKRIAATIAGIWKCCFLVGRFKSSNNLLRTQRAHFHPKYWQQQLLVQTRKRRRQVREAIHVKANNTEIPLVWFASLLPAPTLGRGSVFTRITFLCRI